MPTPLIRAVKPPLLRYATLLADIYAYDYAAARYSAIYASVITRYDAADALQDYVIMAMLTFAATRAIAAGAVGYALRCAMAPRAVRVARGERAESAQ